jgi:hypothetical protein
LLFWCHDKSKNKHLLTFVDRRSVIYVQDVSKFKDELQTPNDGFFSAKDLTTFFPSSSTMQRQLTKRMESVLDVERSNNKHHTRNGLQKVVEVFVITRAGRIQIITLAPFFVRTDEERFVQVLPMDTRTGSKHEESDSDSSEEEGLKVVHAANDNLIVHVVGDRIVMGSNEPDQVEENLKEDADVAELQGLVSTVAALNHHVLFLTHAGELFVLGDKQLFPGEAVTGKLRMVHLEDKIEQIEAYYTFVVAHSQENVYVMGPFGIRTIIKKDTASFTVSVHSDYALAYFKTIVNPVDAAYKLEKEIDSVKWEIERLKFEFNESMCSMFAKLPL